MRGENVKMVPLVISTTGVIPKCLHESIKLLELASTSFNLMQATDTTRVVRKFVN